MRPLRIGAGTAKALAAATVVFAAVPPAQPAYAATTNFYVDPVNGSERNSGTSTAAAFKTIQAAKAAVRAVNANMSDDIVVNLRGGIYPLTTPITFGTSDSGTNGHTVVYQAYNGETPVITSGRAIIGWTAAAGGEYKAPVGTLDFRQMYVNGVRATRARYPDIGSDFQLQGSDKTRSTWGRPTSSFSLTTRQDLDRPATRGHFEIRASNDPSFATYTVLQRQTDTLPLASTLTGNIDVGQKFRYVRVAKTDGAYFFIADFSVQQAGGALEDSTGTPNINASTYYTIKNVNSGQLMDVYQNSTADGAHVVQWPSNSGANQQWDIVPVSGQLYRIVNRNSGKVLDINASSHRKGTALQQYTYGGGNNQLWYFEPTSGGYVIRNFESRQVLEVGGGSTADGAAISQWMPLNQSNQAWTIQ